MFLGSIHSFSRLTVSPLPAPRTPEMRMITGKRAPLSRSYWASSKSARNAGSMTRYCSLESLWPISAASNMTGTSVRELPRHHDGERRQDREQSHFYHEEATRRGDVG